MYNLFFYLFILVQFTNSFPFQVTATRVSSQGGLDRSKLIVVGQDLTKRQYVAPKTESRDWFGFYDRNGLFLDDIQPSDSRIAWDDVNPSNELETTLFSTSGVFSYQNCSGALVKNWQGEGAPPADLPAYGVASAWCLRNFFDNSTRLAFNTTVDLEVRFKSYVSTGTLGRYNAKVNELPLLTFKDYELAVMKFELTALELYNQGLKFYPTWRVDDDIPAMSTTITYRTDQTTKFLKWSTGQFLGKKECTWWYPTKAINLQYQGYTNKYCLSSATNYHALGSPTFEAGNPKGRLLFLMDETVVRVVLRTKMSGTRVDWINECFNSQGVFDFNQWHCLPEWKIWMQQTYNVDLPGVEQAKLGGYTSEAASLGALDATSVEESQDTTTTTTDATATSTSTSTSTSTLGASSGTNSACTTLCSKEIIPRVLLTTAVMAMATFLGLVDF